VREEGENRGERGKINKPFLSSLLGFKGGEALPLCLSAWLSTLVHTV
jgi:hypothetical protein